MLQGEKNDFFAICMEDAVEQLIDEKLSGSINPLHETITVPSVQHEQWHPASMMRNKWNRPNKTTTSMHRIVYFKIICSMLSLKLTLTDKRLEAVAANPASLAKLGSRGEISFEEEDEGKGLRRKLDCVW
jgi:hypothetical protein